jgi:protein-S-isoprenylcysteine O-methyltransferase Ste14
VTRQKRALAEQAVRPGRRPRLRLGALIGLALHAASRLLAPDEKADLAERFGPEWGAYRHRVKVPWL